MTPADLRARGGLKWTFYDEDVLAGWVAEMDFGLAPEVAEALRDAVDRGDTGYHYPRLERETASAAASFWEAWLGWRVDPDRVFAAPDVIEGIRRAIVHLTRPGTPVVLHTPVYYPFFTMVERAGRQVVQAPSHRDTDGRYRLNLDAIDVALAEGAGSIVLCNPWNPTGRSLTEDEIAGVVELARRHRARVIADEVHAPLTYQGEVHVPAASVAPELVVTVTSASKAWNLPGLKCAQVVLPNDEDVEVWSGYFTAEKVGVSTFGLVANAAAYSNGRSWLSETLQVLEGNRKLLHALMTDRLPGVGYHPPEGTYLAWLDFGSHGIDDPASFLLDRARVALTDGQPFGIGGAGHARLNFATTPVILEEMIERIANAL